MLSPQRVNPMIATGAAIEKGQPEQTNECTDRQKQKLVLTVGTHEGCGGKIMYVSRLVADKRLNIREYPTQTREDAKCSCRKCKLQFNPYFPIYRDQVTAQRERTC